MTHDSRPVETETSMQAASVERRNALIALCAIASADTGIRMLSCGRLIHQYFSLPAEPQQATGQLTHAYTGKRSGTALFLSQDSQPTLAYSCAGPGILRDKTCIEWRASFDKATARITWISTPTGILFESSNHPIRIEVGTRIVMDRTPAQVVDGLLFSEIFTVAFAMVMYLACWKLIIFYFNIRKGKN